VGIAAFVFDQQHRAHFIPSSTNIPFHNDEKKLGYLCSFTFLPGSVEDRKLFFSNLDPDLDFTCQVISDPDPDPDPTL